MITRFAVLAGLVALAACADAPAPTVTAPAAPTVAATPATPAQPTRPGTYPVFFEPWSANLDDAAHSGLTRVAELARANAAVPIRVIGFADPQGSREANIILSRLRARIVADELVEKGVARNRIRIEFRGPTPGFDSLESRRVEIRADSARPPRR